jgi:hypothetical protein
VGKQKAEEGMTKVRPTLKQIPNPKPNPNSNSNLQPNPNPKPNPKPNPNHKPKPKSEVMKNLSASLDEGLHGTRRDIEDYEGLTLGLKVLCHANAHITEADKADVSAGGGRDYDKG